MLKKLVLLTIITSILFTQNLFSQKDQGYLEIKGTVKVDRTALEGAKISVFKGNVKQKVYNADFNGKFEIKLDLHSQYEIVVGKQGYFSKKLSFNTAIPPEDVGIWTYKFGMELFPEIVGFDASLLDDPIGKIKFVNKIGDFDYDEEYTNNMLRRLKSLMKEYEKAKRAMFEKMVAQADEAFDNKEYDEAIELYDQAIDLDPYDPYPDDQIYMIGRIIREDENAEKNYQKNIAEADRLFAEQSYIDSKKYYNRAIKYQNQKYPNDQIAVIDKILNDQDAMADQLAAKEKAYNDAIAAADRSLQAKQYQPALSKYTEASQIKPAEQYPKDKISELNALIAQMNANDAERAQIEKAYKEAITLADAAFASKQYEAAKGSYVKANEIKPAEQYPKQRISEINNILAANSSIEEKYKGFIKVADDAFAVKEYEISKKNYQQALSIKPNEQYPKDKIAEIDNILQLLAQRKKQETDAAYQRAIVQGDAELNKKAYENARRFYTTASSLKNTEAYPKQKIAEIDKILNEIAAKRRAYDLAIARADNNFNVEKWEEAKVDYQQALGIFPEEQYPRTRINEIDNKLLALKNAKEQKIAREKAYQEAITLGDNLLAQKKYQESKNAYTNALSVKPNEEYPKNKIAEIDRQIAAEKALNDRYNSIITTADQLFINKTYENAKTTYSNALAIKPNEEYPKQKIAEIDAILTQQLADKAKRDEIQKQYDLLITQADANYNNKQWEQAKNIYQQAASLKADEVYPKQRVVEIDNLLAGIADKNRKYEEAITNADQYFSTNSLGEALAQYNVAAGIKPDESYPKTKIAEINGLLEKQRQNEAAYDNYIKLADAALQNTELETAKGQYQAALSVKPNETYPKQKIAEIDVLIAQKLADKARRDQIQKQYDQLIVQADAKFSGNDFENAKSLYQQAVAVKADEIYPKQRISEIDIKLAALAETNKKYQAAINLGDNLLTQKNYQQALAQFNTAASLKPKETYPQQKITEINAVLQQQAQNEANYSNFIKLADAAYQSKNYQNAKAQYQSASGIKPNESYPKTRIAEIDKLIAEENRLAAEQQRIETEYNSWITKADNQFNAKSYTEAKAAYMQASNLKTDEMYPKQRIAEIDNQLNALVAQDKQYQAKLLEGQNFLNDKNYRNALNAYQQASNIKPAETLPKQKMTEIQALIQAEEKINQQYTVLLAQADNLFNQDKYAEAKPVYSQAKSLKPTESYPQTQIDQIDRLLAEKAKRDAELKAQLQAYTAKIKQADTYFSSKQYESAITAYLDAKNIKPDESYPDEQIAKINETIQQNAAALDANFNAAIAKGDNLKNQKQYETAKQQYLLAQNLKPDNTLPKSKLAELQNLIDQANRDKQKQAQIDADYGKFITQADNAFKAKDYTTALAMYKGALGIKAGEKYPRDQIAVCENKMQELAALAAAEEEKRRQAELAASKQSFEGDEFDYKGEQRDEKFLNDLAKKYPEGVTKENYDKKNKKILRIIVNHGGIAKEYIQVKYSYGTFYFRNGQNISRSIFLSETKE